MAGSSRNAPAAPDQPRWVEYMPLADIKFAKRNYKGHDDEGIGASFDQFGVGELPLLDERTGRLVAGHGRVTRARAAEHDGDDPPDGAIRNDDGVWLFPVIRGWRSLSDAHAEGYLMASNQLTVAGGVADERSLLDIMTEVAEADPALLRATGYNSDDLADLRAALAEPDIDQLATALGKGRDTDLWRPLSIRLPPLLHASWKAHVDTHNGDEVLAFADALDVDPADLSADEDMNGG